jgi:uncharacterized membrane protein YgcG
MPIKNICECHNPPGGTVVCEPEQLAICVVKNGAVRRECIDPPDGTGNFSSLSPTAATRYLNWALTHITGQKRQLSDPISPADSAILAQGSYHNIATGEMITFSLPSELNRNSPSSASSSGSGGSSGTASSDSSQNEISSGGTAAAY